MPYTGERFPSWVSRKNSFLVRVLPALKFQFMAYAARIFLRFEVSFKQIETEYHRSWAVIRYPCQSINDNLIDTIIPY